MNIKTLLKQAELFERLAVYGDRKSFLGSLAQYEQLGEEVETPSVYPPDYSPLSGQLQDTMNTAKPTFRLLRDGDHINPEVQKALIRLFPESAAWIQVDGIMGNNTRGAMNRYKQKYQDNRDLSDPALRSSIITKSKLPVH